MAEGNQPKIQTLSELEGGQLKDGEYKALFSGCYVKKECSSHPHDDKHPIAVPADYKLILNETSDPGKGFKTIPTKWKPNLPPTEEWDGYYIDRERKLLLFGDGCPCPKDAPAQFTAEVKKGRDDEISTLRLHEQMDFPTTNPERRAMINEQRFSENVRREAQFCEAAARGIYQNIPDAPQGYGDYPANKGSGDWQTIEPLIPGSNVDQYFIDTPVSYTLE